MAKISDQAIYLNNLIEPTTINLTNQKSLAIYFINLIGPTIN